MESGIYQIRNTRNNRVYIGSSENIKDRLSCHKSLLQNNKHHSVNFQNGYNAEKDKSVFVEEILEYFPADDMKLLEEREQFYLDKKGAQEFIKKTSYKFLELTYNIKPLAGRGFNGEHTEETKLKLSYCNPYQKPILVYDSYGNFIKEW